MKVPDPLPQPGAWIVTADGSVSRAAGIDDAAVLITDEAP